MGTSGRNGDDAKGADAEAQRPALERSPEGRFVIRSSSHPPTEQTGSVDVSGVHDRPDGAGLRDPAALGKSAERTHEGRDATPTGRKSTPAERPRKRRALQDAMQVDLRARCDTPRALPGERPSNRPVQQPSAAPLLAQPLPIPSAAVAEALAPVDEVTRRVRRPGSHPPPSRWSNSQRIALVAVALVALAALALALAL
jgi:hypothetical protein